MSEDALIRYENLEAYCRARKWGPSELASHTGRSVSQCSDMLRRKKTFGEKIARSFEEALGLPRYWLDSPHDPLDPVLSPDTCSDKASVYSDYPEKVDVYHPHVSGENLPVYDNQAAITMDLAPVISTGNVEAVISMPNSSSDFIERRGFITKQKISDNCKFVIVNDDAMANRLIKGDLVLIDPNKTPSLGKTALFTFPNGDYFIRYFEPTSDGFVARDESGRTWDAKQYGLKVLGTYVLMQRDGE